MTQRKMHLFKVMLLKGEVRRRVATTSSYHQAETLATKWKDKYPVCQVVILGSLYTVYKVL